MGVDTNRVERRIRSRHADTLAEVEACASEVVALWNGSSTTDGAMIRQALRAALRNRGILLTLPKVLGTAIDTVGYELSSNLVAAPPYVTVTSLGPVLRATLDAGRIVTTIKLFRVSNEGRYRYVRASENHPLMVEWIETPSMEA